MDRLNSLQAFVKAVEAGSFSGAAELLGQSPQLVGKQVRQSTRSFRIGYQSAQSTLPNSLTLYTGETAYYDASGNLLGVTVNDGGAGAPQKLGTLPQGITLAATPVSVDGTPARLGGLNFSPLVMSALGTQLGTTLTRGTNTVLGGMTFNLPDGIVINAIPVGPLTVTGKTSGMQANGQELLVASKVAVSMAPTLNDAANFATQLHTLDANATATISANGLIRVVFKGARYEFRPAWVSVPSTFKGLTLDSSGNVLVGNGSLQQMLYPAFADLNALNAAAASVDSSATPMQSIDASISATFGGLPYKLQAQSQVTDTPAAQAGKLWWNSGSILYLNNSDNTSQVFKLH